MVQRLPQQSALLLQVFQDVSPQTLPPVEPPLLEELLELEDEEVLAPLDDDPVLLEELLELLDEELLDEELLDEELLDEDVLVPVEEVAPAEVLLAWPVVPPELEALVPVEAPLLVVTGPVVVVVAPIG
jgi:hypothetical protein